MTTVDTRAAYLVGAMERRFKKILQTPEWSEEELDDLGYAMRTEVENSLKMKETVQNRIKHANLVALTKKNT